MLASRALRSVASFESSHLLLDDFSNCQRNLWWINLDRATSIPAMSALLVQNFASKDPAAFSFFVWYLIMAGILFVLSLYSASARLGKMRYEVPGP